MKKSNRHRCHNKIPYTIYHHHTSTSLTASFGRGLDPFHRDLAEYQSNQLYVFLNMSRFYFVKYFFICLCELFCWPWRCKWSVLRDLLNVECSGYVALFAYLIYDKGPHRQTGTHPRDIICYPSGDHEHRLRYKYNPLICNNR